MLEAFEIACFIGIYGGFLSLAVVGVYTVAANEPQSAVRVVFERIDYPFAQRHLIYRHGVFDAVCPQKGLSRAAVHTYYRKVSECITDMIYERK